MDFDALFAAADRLDHLACHVPACPACASEQVQLLSRDAPAGWRCRRCHHGFSFEPASSSGP